MSRKISVTIGAFIFTSYLNFIFGSMKCFFLRSKKKNKIYKKSRKISVTIGAFFLPYTLILFLEAWSAFFAKQKEK
jgi:cytochrome bd-type quinol oxidase subunit 1